jgi:hypothetical protein
MLEWQALKPSDRASAPARKGRRLRPADVVGSGYLPALCCFQQLAFRQSLGLMEVLRRSFG